MAKKTLAVDAGDLRHQVQIQAQSSSSDTFGQPLQSWSTIRTAYASIATQTARELFSQGTLTSAVTHLITVRWSSTAIAPGMRVVFGSHTYKIQAVVNVDERNVITRLYCLELNATS